MTVQQRASTVAIRTRDSSICWTWAEYAERAGRAAAAFTQLGVRRGDTVGLWLRNRPGFHAADAGAMLIGAVSAAIYAAAGDRHAGHVIRDSGCRVLVTEPAFLGSALALRDSRTTDLHHIVMIEGRGPETLEWEHLLADVEHVVDVAGASRETRPSDPLTTVYTSGATGRPKGVVLTHGNVAGQVRSLTETVGMQPDLRVVSTLPVATIAERLCAHYVPMWLGWEVTCCPDPSLAATFIQELRPEFFFAPPPLWEALRSAIMARIDNAEGLRALDAALARVALRRDGRPVPDDLEASCAVSDRAFFAPLRARIGLGEVRHALIGGAPCPLELTSFFHAIGVPAHELYGLAESTGVTAINVSEDGRIGHVGTPLSGVQMKLGPRNEVLLAGDFIADSYQDGPEGRRPSKVDGWLATGDVADVDDTGMLRIVDRIDAQFLSTNGEIVSPGLIERLLSEISPLVGNAFVFGDGRPHLVALMTLDADRASEWARAHATEGKDLGILAAHHEVLGTVAAGVAAANAELPPHQRVLRFLLLGQAWCPGGDELTSALKLKRRGIERKYAFELDALYSGDGVEPAAL